MRNLAAATVALALVACGSQSEPGPAPSAADTRRTQAVAANAAPDLTACARPAPLESSERLRTKPVAVPAALRPVMRSDMESFAFSTRAGGTVCVDASWIEAIDKANLSPGGRFATFGWFGYEAFGHVIVDRAGKGAVIDPGVKPLPSPSGKLLAAIDITESGYGPMNAFTVWRSDPAPISLLAQHEEVPAATDWKVEHWSGERCVELSATPWEVYADPEAPADPPREAFHASAASWNVEPGRCPAA